MKGVKSPRLLEPARGSLAEGGGGAGLGPPYDLGLYSNARPTLLISTIGLSEKLLLRILTSAPEANTRQLVRS